MLTLAADCCLAVATFKEVINPLYVLVYASASTGGSASFLRSEEQMKSGSVVWWLGVVKSHES